jgi:transcriptional regulator with XRE-family HTH domain
MNRESITGGANPTVRRRRLGAELKRLRVRTGLTANEFAERVGWSASKVSRVETGRVSVRPVDVRAALAVLADPAEVEVEALVQLAVQGREKGWWQRYADVLPEWFKVYLGLESAAALLQTYEAELIPGLLQTPDYARTVLAEHPTPNTPDEVERQVALRMGRQARLTAAADPLRLHVVINEAALRRPVGGAAVMRAQFERIAAAAALPTVTVQVLPFAAGVHGANDGPFRVLEFPEPEAGRVVCIDYLVGSACLESLRDVGRYRLLFTRLCDLALPPDESASLIADLAGRPLADGPPD